MVVPGALLGAGVGAYGAGEDNRLKGALMGGTVGAAGGAMGNMLVGESIKQYAKAVGKTPEEFKSILLDPKRKKELNALDSVFQQNTGENLARVGIPLAAGFGTATAAPTVGSYYAGKAVEGNKEASVSDLSELADLASSGALGADVQSAFEGMTSAINQYVEEEIPEKTASASETDYNIYDENAARIARLNNLLRK